MALHFVIRPKVNVIRVTLKSNPSKMKILDPPVSPTKITKIKHDLFMNDTKTIENWVTLLNVFLKKLRVSWKDTEVVEPIGKHQCTLSYK